MQRDVFRKTAAGHAEIRARALGFDARTRGLLILINGELTVGELAARVGFDPTELLLRFVGAGLVEQVASVVRPRPVAPAAAPARPALSLPPPPPAAPPPAPELLPAELAAAQRRAFVELAQHYGPDAERMVEPLQRAATPAQFAAGMATLKETLSVHMGRKMAEQLTRRIVHGA
jgi:hypothetical protein